MGSKNIILALWLLFLVFILISIVWRQETSNWVIEKNWAINFQWPEKVFWTSWFREYSDGKEIIYKVSDTFSACDTIDILSEQEKELQLEISPKKLTRIEYLTILFRAHCIDYINTPLDDEIIYQDIQSRDTLTKKIITTAINKEIIDGFSQDSQLSFRPDQKISKIEALAMLFKLAKFKFKNPVKENNYQDIPDNWKKSTADIASQLGIIHSNKVRGLFYPEEVMKEWTTYKMLKEVARYYR